MYFSGDVVVEQKHSAARRSDCCCATSEIRVKKKSNCKKEGRSTLKVLPRKLCPRLVVREEERRRRRRVKSFFVVWQSGKMLMTTKTGLSDNNNNMEVTGNGKTSARSIGYGSLCPSYDRGRILNLNEARLEPIQQTNFQFKSTYAQFR